MIYGDQILSNFKKDFPDAEINVSEELVEDQIILKINISMEVMAEPEPEKFVGEKRILTFKG